MNRQFAIIGGGPIGLEAALYARTLGHDVTVYERGNEAAANVRDWEFVTLFSPWEMNTTPLGWRAIRTKMPAERLCPTAKELRDQYLLRLAEAMKDAVRPGVMVVTVGKEKFGKSHAIGKPDRAEVPFRLLVRDRNGDERIETADVVLDCSGTYANHRWAGHGGIPAPGEREAAGTGRIFYTIPDVLGRHRERFLGRHTLLLGAGYSAATVLQWAEQLHHRDARTHVSWAIRGVAPTIRAIHDDPLPARASLVAHSLKLADHPPAWLQYLGNCTLERVDAKDGEKLGVTLRYVETDLALAVDEMVALVGYAPDASVYEQLQVHQCYATAGPMKISAALLGEDSGDCLSAGATIGPETLKNPEPNFFILGAKSYGTNSNFLLRVGHRQVRDVFRLIQSDPQLDLYGSGGDAPA
jgi:hypothetical protein